MLNALSYNEEHLSDIEGNKFKRRLKQRIRTIEDTIDLHLNLIGALEMMMDKTYIYKLAVLELNEGKIGVKDPKCLRMVDVSQSYNQYDSLECQKAQKMMFRIDREIMELDFFT